MCSTGYGKLFVMYPSGCTAHPKSVLWVCFRLSCTPSACALCMPQTVLHTLSLYCIPSACTAHPQLVLHTFSLYCIPSACTAHPQPVLHTLSLYCIPSACTAHPQPVLHTLNLYCTYFIQRATKNFSPGRCRQLTAN